MPADIPEGSERVGARPDENAPPEAFHAGMFGESEDDELQLTDKGYGPTSLTGQQEEEKPEPEGDEPPATAAEPAAAKDEGSKAEKVALEPELVEQLKRDQATLRWILDHPQDFVKMAAGKGLSEPEPKPEADEPSANIVIAEARPQKPLTEMDDKEMFEHLVDKQVRDRLREILPNVIGPLGGKVKDLVGFKNTLEDLLLKSAADKEGKPLHPRWDELKPAMQQLKTKHPTLTPNEAYALADKLSPAKEMVGIPEQGPRLRAVPQAEAPAPQPKKPSPKATQAARLAALGRSSQTVRDSGPLGNIREAVERALVEHGITE